MIRLKHSMYPGVISLCLFLTPALPLFAQEGAGEDAGSQTVTVDKKYAKEMQSLARRSAVQKAFATIVAQEPRTRQDHLQLTEIPAPPFREEVRGRQYATMLREAGADSVWTDAVGNVIGLRKGRNRRKTVVLEAHLDTVFPEGTDVKVRQRGDTLYAPGIGDDTRGLAMVLTILRTLEKEAIETDADVLFIGTVGEEGLGDLRGVKHLFSEKGPKIDAYIAIDGGGLDRVTYAGLGSHRYRITYKGPGGHSWGSFGMANPHHALGQAIAHFSTEADRYTREGARTSYNVGIIGGGTSVNSIPFESWMEVDMRSESPERLRGIDAILQKAVQQALQEENARKRRGPDLTVEVKLVGDRPSGALEPNVALIQRTLAATAYFGAQPKTGAGSTNSNIPIAGGVPAVTIGVGGIGGGAHSLGEWWLNDKGYLAIQRACLLLLSEAGIAQ